MNRATKIVTNIATLYLLIVIPFTLLLTSCSRHVPEIAEKSYWSTQASSSVESAKFNSKQAANALQEFEKTITQLSETVQKLRLSTESAEQAALALKSH